jgi:beta-1,4-mannosyl-glycoprotein beta-1,4-N-acetylglucosaminyltransferase
MTVYDCTLFWNENDLYELRLNQHWDFVDKFIVVEAAQTHTGLPKPFNFDHKRFEKYKSKIVYSKFDSFQEEIEKQPELLDNYSLYDRSANGQHTPDWIRDHFQGNYPLKVLKELGAQDDDIIYISALDEILNEQAFSKGKDFLSNNKDLYPLQVGNQHALDQNHQPILTRPSFGFMLDMYVFKFNLFCKNIGVAEMTQFSFLKQFLPSTVRSLGLHTHPNIENAGWHFTFLDHTDGETVFQKYKSWAHSRDTLPGQEIKFEHSSKEESLQRMFMDYNTTEVPMTKESHPAFLMDNLDKYKDYIYE